MKSELPIRSLRLAIKSAFGLALIAATFCAAPQVWAQQNLDSKTDDQGAQKQPEPKKPAPKKQKGFFESIRGTLEFGGRLIDLDGDKPAKFQETRQVPKGLYLRNINLDFENANSPLFFRFEGLEIRERDQRFRGEIGRIGTFRTQFMWDQIPLDYSTGRSLFVSTTPGVLTVDPTLRATLQAVPDAGNPPQTLGPTLPALVRAAVQNAPTIQLRVRSDQLLVTQYYRPTKNWEFYFRAQHIRLNGTRPKGAGTFGRQAVGPAGDGLWESLGVELPEPVDYRTTNLTFGMQYSRPKWRFGVDYFLSFFRDNIPSLTWDNPFRVTDALAIAPAFAVGRNRFARAQQALPPNNDFESLSVHGSVDLPRETQLRGEFSWGRGTQNQAFLPYTLNSAMTSANLPAGVPGLFGLALPQPSLNGVIHTMDQDYALSSKPWKNMRLLLQYRSHTRNNLSPDIVFPAEPAFGDSGERTAIDFYGLPIENLPTSFTRQNTTATWQWDPNKKLSWELEYDWEVWNRKLRDAPRTNEHSVTAKLGYTLMRGVALKGDYNYAHRIPTYYLTQPLTFNPTLQGSALGGWAALPTTRFIRGIPLEFNLLRRFDEDERTRNNGGFSLEVTRSEKFTYSASYRYLRDDYNKSFYGLHYDVISTVDAQVSYFPVTSQSDKAPTSKESWKDNTSFYANFSREQQQTGYRDLGHLIVGAVQDVTACCAQFPIANTYDRSSRIKFNNFQFGINTASAGEKTVLDISYGLGFARDITHTTNPFPILANSPITAGAYNYPDVINWQQEFNISLTHKLREGLDVGASYRFEPYRLDDYYTNNIQPYAGPTLITDGGHASVPVPRQLFLDARFTSMHANVATVFLRYSF
jgi:MtrB/PioB family decaheme-associated outer membrane protein